MSADRSGMSRLVWLWLLNQGGFSTAREIAIGLGFSKTEEVTWVVASMFKSGHINRREKAAGHLMRFGVTASCKVPMNVTLKDLAECGAVQLEEGDA